MTINHSNSTVFSHEVREKMFFVLLDDSLSSLAKMFGILCNVRAPLTFYNCHLSMNDDGLEKKSTFIEMLFSSKSTLMSMEEFFYA